MGNIEEHIEYYETGEVWRIKRFGNGLLNGFTEIYFLSGILNSRFNYSNGMRNGITEFFDTKGWIISRRNCKNNSYDGYCAEYHNTELTNHEIYL
jgi:antitoxin component YwqK of YwqJK toxin-antitoxin module